VLVSDVLHTYDDFKRYRTVLVYLHRHRALYAAGSDAYTNALAERLQLAYPSPDKPPPVTADAITFTRQQLDSLQAAIRRSQRQLGANATLEQAYAALHTKRTAAVPALQPADEDVDDDEEEREQALCIKREQECQRLFHRLPVALLKPQMQSIRVIYENGRITRPCFLWCLLCSDLATAWSDKDVKGINGAVCTAWRLTMTQLNKELESWAWKSWQVRELQFRSTTAGVRQGLSAQETNLSEPSNVALVVFALLPHEAKLRAYTADLTRDQIHPRRWCTPALSAALGKIDTFDMDDSFTCLVANWMIGQEEGEDEENESNGQDRDEKGEEKKGR
jgi:hypothetical protein